MENKIYEITELERDALLFFYYCCLYGLDNFKGLSYKNCFKFKKQINDIANDLIKRSINVNDFIIVKKEVY